MATDHSSYKAQLKNLTLRNLSLQYKGSVLGFFWVFLEPLLYMIILSFVFTRILKFEMESYPLFLLAGLLPWNFFSHALTEGTTSIIQDANLVKNIEFRRELLPVSSVLSTFINLLFGLLLFISLLVLLNRPFSVHVLFLPVVLIFHMMFALGLVLFLSCMNVYLRDINNFVKFGLMLWFYMTPVFYPMSMVPEGVFSIYRLNPMVSVLATYRAILLDGQFPQAYDLLFFGLTSIISVIAGFAFFSKYQTGLAKVL